MFEFPKVFSRSVILAPVTVLMLGCGGNTTTAPLALDDGWVRAMPPGTTMTAAYGRFINTGADTLEITSFASDSFASVSLHQTTTGDGMSKMKPVKSWSIGPGDTAVLEPGGLHLMLMQPTRDITVGSTIELSLNSAPGESYLFRLKVEAR